MPIPPSERTMILMHRRISRAARRRTKAVGRRSRPARIRELEAATRDLIDEYGDWLCALPDNLAMGAMADHLIDTMTQLVNVAETLACIAIDPPRVGRRARLPVGERTRWPGIAWF